LENHPQFVDFQGYSQDRARCFGVYDRRKEIQTENREFRQRLAAANKVNELNLTEVEELILQVKGSGYELPKGTPEERLQEGQMILIDHIEESPNGIQDVLMSRGTADDKMNVLIGKAVNLGILSFEKIGDAVAMNRSGSWAAVKIISSQEYDFDTRQRHFGEFLLSSEGMYLKTDIEREVAKKSSEGYVAPVVIEEKQETPTVVTNSTDEGVKVVKVTKPVRKPRRAKKTAKAK
jgi:hypothetical protein